MGHHHDTEERYSQATWDERYAGTDRVWSGNPNRRLVEQVAGLTAGTALDVGAGEGADAVWLAGRGWRVTALDVSPVALARTRAHAEEAGVGDRVTTLQHDLIAGGAVPGTYDLVSAQFWHPPVERRSDFDAQLGEAVRPGGHLLVVGHNPADFADGRADEHGHAAFLFTPDDIVAVLPEDRWEILLAAEQTRPTTRDDGPPELTDTVVLARRR